jgi:integrase
VPLVRACEELGISPRPAQRWRARAWSRDPADAPFVAIEQADFQRDEIVVDTQWCAKTASFETPKHQHVRTIALTEPARDRLLNLSRESEFCFTTLRGSHYRPSSRSHHWDRVRCSAGVGDLDFYLCTRHAFATYALNVFGLSDHVIATQLGHRDGGKLVRTLYGHPDAALTRERVREASRNPPPAPVPLVAAAG